MTKISTLISCCFKALANIGTFMLGLATLIALWQTSGSLEKILEIREGVKELKKGNKQLYEIIKNSKASEVASLSPQDQAEALKALVPQKNIKVGDLYLPREKFEQAEEIFKSGYADLSKIKTFLQKNLKIKTE